MAKQPEDQNIKSQARRRLIGASVLALAVVVILPMVLDSEPKMSGNDIELSIPETGKTGVIVPGASAPTLSMPPSVSAPALAPVTAHALAPVTAHASEPVVHAASAVLPNAIPHPVASGKITLGKPDIQKPLPVTKPLALPHEILTVQSPLANKVEVKKQHTNKPILPVHEKKREMKPVVASKSEFDQLEQNAEKKLAAVLPEKHTHSYIVQVAAFSNSITAEQVAENLKELGFNAYVESVRGSTRVRVGPYSDRSAAQKAQSALQKNGRHPVIMVFK
jgi:DedD protein